MSLMGIDIGTTGCKVVVFSEDGKTLSSAYAEYDIKHPDPQSTELDSIGVWNSIKSNIRIAASQVASSDPVQAISTSSLGEAVVPVSADRKILGPSMLMNDARGNEYLESVRCRISDTECFQIAGNAVGSQFGFTKLMWIRDNKPGLYRQTWKFLNWGSFVAFMLGAEPCVDYSLANRFLLFDINACNWSERLLAIAGLERSKLPDCVPAGSIIGVVPAPIAGELSLQAGTPIACGSHDQCANALGCGVIHPGEAMYGMGTFPTILPIYDAALPPEKMVEFGLNMEHHALPGVFVSFAYHMGGSVVKWYRDTFAAAESKSIKEQGGDIYPKLFSELPDEPGSLFVLPNFAPMGPPDFLSDSSGVILGLRNYTQRGEILKAILESNVFALKISVENLKSLGVPIRNYKAVGGGSRSDEAIQIAADILDSPFECPAVGEAGALGAAILAGTACGVYGSAAQATSLLVKIRKVFNPDKEKVAQYRDLFDFYRHFSKDLTDLTQQWNEFRKKRKILIDESPVDVQQNVRYCQIRMGSSTP
ncbi:MAG: hypothetical protein LLF89_01695 [Spirochaetaceae bacterium]|nr:hypothetical protein [Spirochaetaceae bacterium]